MPADPEVYTVTINSDYEPDPDPAEVPVGWNLEVVPPTGGCTICLDKDLGGSKAINLSSSKIFDLSGHKLNDTWGYDIVPYETACPSVKKRNASHSIVISSGGE